MRKIPSSWSRLQRWANQRHPIRLQWTGSHGCGFTWNSCVKAWYKPCKTWVVFLHILTKLWILMGKFWSWNVGAAEFQTFSRPQQWIDVIGKQRWQDWRSPCLLVKWFVAGYSLIVDEFHWRLKFSGISSQKLHGVSLFTSFHHGGSKFLPLQTWNQLRDSAILPGAKELLHGNFAPGRRWQARLGCGEVWRRPSTGRSGHYEWWILHGSVGLELGQLWRSMVYGG